MNLQESDLLTALSARDDRKKSSAGSMAARRFKPKSSKLFKRVSTVFLPSAHDQLKPDEVMNFEIRMMLRAENEQLSHHDTFWGIDKQTRDCARERREMAQEDMRSHHMELYYKHIIRLHRWEKEETDELDEVEQDHRRRNEERRRLYLSQFMKAGSSEDIIHYSWTRSAVEADWDENDFYPGEMPESTARMRTAAKSRSGTGHQGGSAGAEFGSPDMFALDIEGAYPSPRNTSSIRGTNKLQKSVMAPLAQDGHVGTQQASVGTLNDNLYLEPVSWIKKISKQKGDSGENFTNSSKDSAAKNKLMEKSRVIRSISEIMAQPRHFEAVDGHPVHKWDQRSMLQQVFSLMDEGKEGLIGRHNIKLIEIDNNIHNFLRFTILGSWVKHREWGKFFKLFDDICTRVQNEHTLAGKEASSRVSSSRGENASDPPSTANSAPHTAARISCKDWLEGIRAVAFTTDPLSLKAVRTDEEHRLLSGARVNEDWAMLQEGNSGSERMWFAECKRYRQAGTLREFEMRRVITEGDFVWGLHLGGPYWLPAVVERVSTDKTQYWLRYPFTSQDLLESRMLASSKQFLHEGISVQDMKMTYRPDSSTAKPPALSGPPPTGDVIPIKPFKTEKEACSYAFDRMNTKKSASIDLNYLLNTLRSPKYERVVSSSYCLSQIITPLHSNLLLSLTSEDQNKSIISKESFLNYCAALEHAAILSDK